MISEQSKTEVKFQVNYLDWCNKTFLGNAKCKFWLWCSGSEQTFLNLDPSVPLPLAWCMRVQLLLSLIFISFLWPFVWDDSSVFAWLTQLPTMLTFFRWWNFFCLVLCRLFMPSVLVFHKPLFSFLYYQKDIPNKANGHAQRISRF